MNTVAATQALSPAPPEQAISTVLVVEIMNDLDDGRPTLIASTEGNQSDLQEVTPAELRAKVAAARVQLARIEHLALAYEAATVQPTTDEAKTWVVADQDTGMPLKVTCMSGCNDLHLEAASGTAAEEDIRCTQYDVGNTVEFQIGHGGNYDDGDWATLSVQIAWSPFGTDDAERIPTAAVEVTEDHYIECRDPDALAAVIDKLQQRVTAMRVRHAEFIRIRNEHARRTA